MVAKGIERQEEASRNEKPPLEGFEDPGLPSELDFVVDKDIVTQILAQVHYSRWKDKKALELLLHTGTPHDGDAKKLTVPCTYVSGAGGWFAQARKYTTTSSLQGMGKRVRAALARAHGWCDVDIVNAFPTLLLVLLEQAGISCPALRLYVTDRDRCFRDWSRDGVIDGDALNRAALAILFGGNYEEILTSSGIPVGPHSDLDHFKSALKQATRALSKCTAYKALYRRAKDCADSRKAQLASKISTARDNHTKALRSEAARLQRLSRSSSSSSSRSSRPAALLPEGSAPYAKEIKLLQAEAKSGGNAWSGGTFHATKSTNALAIFTSWACQHAEAKAMACFIRLLEDRELLGGLLLRCVAQIFDGCLVDGLFHLPEQKRAEVAQVLSTKVAEMTGLSSGSASVSFAIKPLEVGEIGREFDLDEYDDLVGLNPEQMHIFDARYCLATEEHPGGLSIQRDLFPYDDWFLKASCNTGKSHLTKEIVQVLQPRVQQQRQGKVFTALFGTSRKALTAQIVSTFKDAKMNIQPYLAISGRLDLAKHPVSVWQLDSLPRAVKGLASRDLPVFDFIFLDEVRRVRGALLVVVVVLVVVVLVVVCSSH